jgi:integrase
VNHGRGIDDDTRRYYRYGAARIQQTDLMNVRLDQISSEMVDRIPFSGAPAYVNQTLRTLRRLLGKAEEAKLIAKAPRIKLAEERPRETIIDEETEAALLANANDNLRDALIISQDTGGRPDEVIQLRIEHINWRRRRIFNPSRKTPKARRYLPISQRMLDLLMVRCAGKTDGWLFPAARKSGSGHISYSAISHSFLRERRRAGLPENIVWYSARHTFWTELMEFTGDPSLVMKQMSQKDFRTTSRYLHPDTERARNAIDRRNRERRPSEGELERAEIPARPGLRPGQKRVSGGTPLSSLESGADDRT